MPVLTCWHGYTRGAAGCVWDRVCRLTAILLCQSYCSLGLPGSCSTPPAGLCRRAADSSPTPAAASADAFRKRMKSWQDQDRLLLFLAAKEMVFEVAVNILLGFDVEARALQCVLGTVSQVKDRAAREAICCSTLRPTQHCKSPPCSCQQRCPGRKMGCWAAAGVLSGSQGPAVETCGRRTPHRPWHVTRVSPPAHERCTPGPPAEHQQPAGGGPAALLAPGDAAGRGPLRHPHRAAVVGLQGRSGSPQVRALLAACGQDSAGGPPGLGVAWAARGACDIADLETALRTRGLLSGPRCAQSAQGTGSRTGRLAMAEQQTTCQDRDLSWT